MIKWETLINALGKPEESKEFFILCKSIGEKPIILEDPIEYNDPEKSKYFKFIFSGIEITVINHSLKQLHLYLIKNEDNYHQYCGEIPFGINSSYSEIAIVNLLGTPTAGGGGKADGLLGYINKWISYYINNSYSLRFEFNSDGKLSAITLTTLPI